MATSTAQINVNVYLITEVAQENVLSYSGNAKVHLICLDEHLGVDYYAEILN